MKVIKILFLVATAIVWVPFWIAWKVLKFLNKCGFTVKTHKGW